MTLFLQKFSEARLIYFLLFVTAFLVAALWIYNYTQNTIMKQYINNESETTYLEIVTRQRNSLSRMLNEIKMDMGQHSCTMLELRELHGEKVR